LWVTSFLMCDWEGCTTATIGRRENVRVPPSLYIQVYRSGSPGQILGARG
jgi:hypothetical protein